MFGNGSWLVVVLMVGILLVGLLRRQSMVLVKFMFIPVAMITLILSLNEVVGIIPLTRMRYFLILWIPLTIIAAAGLSFPKPASGCDCHPIVLVCCRLSVLSFGRNNEPR